MQQLIKVLIADGSGYVRLVMSDILNAVPGIEVVDTAIDGKDMLQKIEQYRPNVVILDIDISNSHNIGSFRQVLKQNNAKLIISGRESDLMGSAGVIQKTATSCIVKPDSLLLPQLREIASELIAKVKEAATEKPLINNWPEKTLEDAFAKTYNLLQRRKKTTTMFTMPSYLIVLGGSTGGSPAIEYILKELPDDFSAAVLVAQHMPPGFSKKFVQRLNGMCTLQVEEARAGARLEAGKVMVATSEANMIVKTIMGSKNNLCVDFSYDDYSLYDRPSIDLLMQSCATAYNEKTIGVILSGMGKDGSAGLKAINNRGGYTLAQDQASSVIYGMAKVAVEEGSIDKILPLSEIPKYLINYVKLNEALPL